MTRILLFVGLVAAAGCAADTHPDFTGTWQLSIAASNFGTATPPRAMVSRIRHKEPAFIVNSIVVNAMGEQESEYRWWTDGKTSSNTVGGLNFTTKVVWEGSTLVATSSTTGQQGPIEMADRWTLTTDGSTIKVSRVLKTGGRVIEQSYVYERK